MPAEVEEFSKIRPLAQSSVPSVVDEGSKSRPIGAQIACEQQAAGGEGEEGEEGEKEEEPGDELVPAPGVLSKRFWMDRGHQLVRRVFDTLSAVVPPRAIELHRQVLEQPIMPLGQYPGFTAAITEVVRAECVARRSRVAQATACVVDQITADLGQFFHYEPSADLLNVTIHFVPSLFINALKVAIIRHLPSAEQFKVVVAERPEIKLSSFKEDGQAEPKRREINERLSRVRTAVRGLVRALDVDESNPLDGAWLVALQAEHGLPENACVLYTDEELTTACSKFESFHRLDPGSATAEQVQCSSVQINGWLKTSLPAIEAKAAAAATRVQSAARRRGAIKMKTALASAMLEPKPLTVEQHAEYRRLFWKDQAEEEFTEEENAWWVELENGVHELACNQLKEELINGDYD